MKEKINGRKVCLIGFLQRLEMELKAFLVENIEDAKLILVNGDGLVSDEGARSIPCQCPGKEMLFIGPSTSGVAVLQKIPPLVPVWEMMPVIIRKFWISDK